MDTKILNKIPANQINSTSKEPFAMIKWYLWFNICKWIQVIYHINERKKE